MTQFNKHDQGAQFPKHLLGHRAIDRDKLAMTPRHKAVDAAMLAYFQLQDIKEPEEQVMGAAILFMSVCLKANIDPSELGSMAKRVMFAQSRAEDAATSNSMQVLFDMLGARILAREVTVA